MNIFDLTADHIVDLTNEEYKPDNRIEEYRNDRLKYGVSNWEIFNFDAYLLYVIAVGLRKFAEHNIAVPYGYKKKCGEDNSYKIWQEEIISKAELAEEVLNSDGSQEGWEKGKELFAWIGEHLSDLWI